MIHLNRDTDLKLKIRWMSGGSKPEEIRSFATIKETKEHFRASKPISYGKNFYYVSVNGSGIRVNIEDLGNEFELEELLEALISSDGMSNLSTSYQYFSETMIHDGSSDSSRGFLSRITSCGPPPFLSVGNRMMRFINKSGRKATKTGAVLGTLAGLKTGGVGIALAGTAFGATGPVAGAIVGASIGAHMDAK